MYIYIRERDREREGERERELTTKFGKRVEKLYSKLKNQWHILMENYESFDITCKWAIFIFGMWVRDRSGIDGIRILL